MGSWAADAFGNDDAMDWLSEFESDPEAAVIAALDIGDGVVEVDAGAAAVAAAEAVATAFGKSSPEVDEDVIARILPHVEAVRDIPDVRDLAIAALEEVLGENSELAELWNEADDPAWAAAVADLSDRLE
ncbi:DUF4259 domain-containing protein [Paroceanicella profunda]|uniref:DUF4259 domain-containing protein n=1 Tax=Paroceanicella profunda TaxID=2579971 RepID=A0A5B8FI98_9RHOB|nr:DUF4259 domain-containing protein [Paroceanicella profunda]QDL92997.1 DUF4259 domain-containing protein [Paroceanicella profunda]